MGSLLVPQVPSAWQYDITVKQNEPVHGVEQASPHFKLMSPVVSAEQLVGSSASQSVAGSAARRPRRLGPVLGHGAGSTPDRFVRIRSAQFPPRCIIVPHCFATKWNVRRVRIARIGRHTVHLGARLLRGHVWSRVPFNPGRRHECWLIDRIFARGGFPGAPPCRRGAATVAARPAALHCGWFGLGSAAIGIGAAITAITASLFGACPRCGLVIWPHWHTGMATSRIHARATLHHSSPSPGLVVPTTHLSSCCLSFSGAAYTKKRG